jgi:enoyl-CoA hydratase/carnithine racemase
MSAIRYEVAEHIATITIDRPEKRNAMSYAVLGEFHDAVARAGTDAAVRSVVLTGAGGAFCAGTDLSDLAATPESERAGQGRAASRAAWPLVACPKPVIAAVDGPAVGMGAEFATQCDVRLASTRARFAWNFVLRGLVPDTGAGTFLLPRIIGPTEALRLLYSGEFLVADDALRLGFVSAVVEADDLLGAAHAEAQRFNAGSPFSISRTKRLVYEAMVGEVGDHLARTASLLHECFGSDDHREGVAAFLERREPTFTGT